MDFLDAEETDSDSSASPDGGSTNNVSQVRLVVNSALTSQGSISSVSQVRLPGNSASAGQGSTSNVSEVSTPENIFKLKYFDSIAPKMLACHESGDYSDVNLKVGKTEFKCHRLLLAANSPYFVSLFKNDFKEGEENIISLPHQYVNENSFSKLLGAIYSGKPLEIEGDLVPLYIASVYLQLMHFNCQLEEYMIKKLDSIDSIELLMLREVQMNDKLYAVVKKHICLNFPKLSSRMAQISLEVFEDIFTDPELFITSKDQVLDFGKKWISHNIQERKIHIQKVAALLKPFHAPSGQLQDLVNNLVSHLHNDYDVKVALKTLLEYSSEGSHRDIPRPLFFVQPNSLSETYFGTYRDGAWVFLNEFHLPLASDLLLEYEGAVARNMIYLMAEYTNCMTTGTRVDLIFRGFVGETREWVELISPRSMPQCLVTCNQMVYSYEHSDCDHQISVFEPFLNRWLKVPAVNYPRTYAGIASSGNVLYMVGGVPRKPIASTTPTNIIEMYDTRCENWSRVHMSSKKTILNDSHEGLVCYQDNRLYMIEKTTSKLSAIDVRNNSWLPDVKTPASMAKPACGRLISVNKKLWFVNDDASKGIHLFNERAEGSKREIQTIQNVTEDVMADADESLIISNPNVFIKPISSQND